MNKILFSCVILSLLALGCNSYPVSRTSAVDSRPTLSFTGGTPTEQLFVDGIGMGSAAQYDGNPKVLVVTPGTHEISVTDNSRTVFQRSIFVESEHKTISIH